VLARTSSAEDRSIEAIKGTSSSTRVSSIARSEAGLQPAQVSKCGRETRCSAAVRSSQDDNNSPGSLLAARGSAVTSCSRRARGQRQVEHRGAVNPFRSRQDRLFREIRKHPEDPGRDALADFDQMAHRLEIEF